MPVYTPGDRQIKGGLIEELTAERLLLQAAFDAVETLISDLTTATGVQVSDLVTLTGQHTTQLGQRVLQEVVVGPVANGATVALSETPSAIVSVLAYTTATGALTGVMLEGTQFNVVGATLSELESANHSSESWIVTYKV